MGSDFKGSESLIVAQSQWEQEAAGPILVVTWEADARTYSSRDHT